MDHYEALDLRTGATAEEIRAAYVQLARRYHPDTNADADAATKRRCETRMREVNAAWAVLGDAERRRQYDDELTWSRSRPTAGSTTSDAEDPWAFRPFDPGDDPPPPVEDTGGVRTHSQGLSMAPVLLFVLSVASLIVGAMTGIAPLLALAGAAMILSLLLFVVVPLVALTASQRAERE